MPRPLRRISETNQYHVVFRGINRQQIFEDDQDRAYLFGVLKGMCRDKGCRVHAYCFMGNHVHLLLETPPGELSSIMQQIESSYVKWYNNRYQRIGSLFQGRFYSNPIDTEKAYMAVLRYIIQNPMRAGMELRPGTYRWSSFHAYQGQQDSLTTVEYTDLLCPSRAELVEFLRTPSKASEVALYCSSKIDEKLIHGLIQEFSGCSNISEIMALNTMERNVLINNLRKCRIPAAVIARYTGLSRRVVEAAMNQKKS